MGLFSSAMSGAAGLGRAGGMLGGAGPRALGAASGALGRTPAAAAGGMAFPKSPTGKLAQDTYQHWTVRPDLIGTPPPDGSGS